MKILRLFLLLSIPVATCYARDFRPVWHLENILAGDASIQQCYVFQTTPGVKYTVESTNNLSTWTSQDEHYGIGNEYVVTMREYTPPPPPPPGTPPSNPPAPAANVSLRIQPASGAAGGSVVSWPSLDHGGPMIVRIAGEMDAGWNSIPIFSNRFGAYNFFFWHPGTPVAPPADNPPLGLKDTAMLAVLETSVPEINLQIAVSIFQARNAPLPAPPDPNSKRFWRVKVDWSIDTDQDGCADWAEFEIAARGTGMLVPGAIGDAFDPDTNNDSISDGKQLDVDGDGTPDADDPDADDDTATFPIGPIPRYALFPITNADPTTEWPFPIQINDKGTVLYANGTWKGGVWTPLTLEVTGFITHASTRGINDSDTILGVGYDDAISSFPSYFAGLACYWPTPTDLPSTVEISGESLVRAVNLEPGTTASDLFGNGLCPGPVLANDGGFYFPMNRLKADGSEWIFEHHSRWKLPSGGQPITETSASAALRYSTGLGLQWGFDPARTVGSVTAGGSVLAGSTLPVLPFMPTNVIVQPGESVLAMPSYGSYEQTRVLIDGAWKPSELHAYAIDMSSTDGTAIGNLNGNINPSVLINGKWTAIERVAPISKGALDPPPPWHESTVSFQDTTPGGWILAEKYNTPDPEHAVLLPIRAEGSYTRTEENPDGSFFTDKKAVGVDDYSVGSSDPGTAVQDRIWIMAPQNSAGNVTLKAPLNPEAKTKITAAGCTFSGQESINLQAAETTFTLQADATTATGSDLALDLKMGPDTAPTTSLSKPIGLKVMKNRVVKVNVYGVCRRMPPNGAYAFVNAMSTAAQITAHLNDMFKPQINVTFDVVLVKTDVALYWDGNGNQTLDTARPGLYSTEQDTILDALPPGPANRIANVRVIVVGSRKDDNSIVKLDGDAYGVTNRTGTAARSGPTCWILGEYTGKQSSNDAQLDTIAHEVGHVFVGYGHPDNALNKGPAPLPGMEAQIPFRLMSGGALSSANSRLLVKGEWDAAEIWLTSEVDE